MCKTNLTKELYNAIILVKKYKMKYNYNYLLNRGLWDRTKAKGTVEEEALFKCIDLFKEYGIDIKDKQTINLLVCEYGFTSFEKIDFVENERSESEAQTVYTFEDDLEYIDIAYVKEHYVPHRLGYLNIHTEHILKVNFDFNLLRCFKDGERLFTDKFGRVLIQEDTDPYKVRCINLPFCDSMWIVKKISDKVNFVKHCKTGFYLVVRT